MSDQNENQSEIEENNQTSSEGPTEEAAAQTGQDGAPGPAGKAPGGFKKGIGILLKLVTLFIAIFALPVCFIILLFFTTTDGLDLIENANTTMVKSTSETSESTKVSKKKSEDELSNMMKLNILNVTYSIAGKIELIFQTEDGQELLEDPDEIETNDKLLNLIRSEKIGNSGSVCILDTKNDKVILHQTVDGGESISEELPELWQLIKTKNYGKILEELERTKQLAAQGLGGGLANKRSGISGTSETDEGLEGEKVVEFYVVTPINDSPFSLASQSSLGGLTKTIMKGISEAMEKVEKNVNEVKKKSEEVKDKSEDIRKKYEQQVMLTFVLGTIFLIIILIILQKSFLKPIAHLTKTAEKIETGDLKVRTNVKTRDELQILGDSFNSMLDRIVKQISSLDKIVETGKEISATMELENLCNLVCDELQEMTESHQAIMALTQTETGDISLSDEGFGFKAFSLKGLDVDNICFKKTGALFKALEHMQESTLFEEVPASLSGTFFAKEGSFIAAPVHKKAEEEDDGHGNKKKTDEPVEDELIGFLILAGKEGGYTQEDLAAVKTIVTNVEIQIMNINLLAETADKARMDAELRTAQAVQAALFPDKDPQLPCLDLAGYFQSSSETGGDWYGYVYEDDKIHILIGDVTGHGTPAALVTASVRGTCSSLQCFWEQSKAQGKNIEYSPGFILKNLNEAVYLTGRQKFVMTFFAATFYINSGRLVYANAGHNAPWILRKNAISPEEKLNPLKMDKKVGVLAARGNRLGYNRDAIFPEKETSLDAGDIVVFFTDGLIECEDTLGVEYGKKSPRRILVKNRDKSSEEIKDALVEDAFKFFGECPRKDDVTILVQKIPVDAKFNKSEIPAA